MRKLGRGILPCFIGLDLAAVNHRPSGFCTLSNNLVHTKLLFEDSEILEVIISSKPPLVAIDAPLTLPRGRFCLKDDCTCPAPR